MAKSPKPGVCVHCLKHSDERNWDHVIPASWYPDSTPADLERWKIPSCVACNSAYGKLERDLLQRLGLCLDPADARAAGITDKALRAIKPEFAKDEKDRRAREGLRRKYLSEMFQIDETMDGFFPGFGPSDNKPSRTAIPVSRDALVRLGEKLARGITYVETGELISRDHHIQTNFVHAHDVGSVEEILRKHAVTSHRGPGLVVERAAIAEDPVTAIFRVTVWGRVKFYMSVFSKALAAEYGYKLDE